jgi:hypothetical protein
VKKRATLFTVVFARTGQSDPKIEAALKKMEHGLPTWPQS